MRIANSLGSDPDRRHRRIISARRSPVREVERIRCGSGAQQLAGLFLLVFITCLGSPVHSLTERDEVVTGLREDRDSTQCTSLFESSKPTPRHQSYGSHRILQK